MMRKNSVLFLCISFLLFSCVYEDSLSEYAANDLAESVRLSSSAWSRASDLVLLIPAVTPPAGESAVYQLGFSNILYGGSFEGHTLVGTTGFLESFSSSTAAINTDSQMTGTNYLELTLKRDVGDDYFYHTFDVTDDATNFKFKFDYKHISYGNMQISYGDPAVDSLYWEIESVVNPVGTVIKTFSVDTLGAGKHIRFGLGEDNRDEKGFQVYLDNIALFEDTGHRISRNKTIGETGVYKLTMYAKALTSDKITLELGNLSKTWDLDSTWKEVEVQANGFASNGSIYMAIIPTGAAQADEYPGYIYLTEPKLYLLPGQAAPEN